MYLAVLRRSPSSDLAAKAGSKESQAASDVSKLTLHDFEKFISNPAGLAAVITGAVASFGFYIATYLASDVWGSSVTQWFALIAGMFGAFITAGTASRFTTNLGRPQLPSGQ
jgi:hypothetical protein